MTRALVLSGGGSVGIAWQSGLTVGLASSGVRLADADFVVGTSAGSAVGAQIALGRDLNEQVERYRRAATPAAARPSSAQQPMGERMQRLMQVMAESMTSDAPPEQTRAEIGRFALEAETGPEEQFVQGFKHLSGEPWPRRYACTAVDAQTGEFVVWDADAGADLAYAVASSCAVPGVFPPITINGRRYIDGGMRSGTNADLAKGHDRVLIVSLMSTARATTDAPADPRMERYRQRMDAELGVLTDSGATIDIVGPDAEAAAALGVNLMDSSRLREAAEAGIAQGKREADRIRAFWGD